MSQSATFPASRSAAAFKRLLRLNLLEVLATVTAGEPVYAAPASAFEPVCGGVVEISGLCLALRTRAGDVVWVHAEDCPDLVLRAKRLR